MNNTKNQKLTAEQFKCGHVEKNGRTSIKWTGDFCSCYKNRYNVSGEFEGHHNLGYYKTLSQARKVAIEFNEA